MDLSAFYSGYRADGHGRPAHDPSMMVALLVYAYARGQRSSRVIERGCFEDIAFRVISANRRPDHTTIARFRQRHERALAALFGQVLGPCAQAGLADVAVLAVDGTRVHANASERATRITFSSPKRPCRGRPRSTPARTSASGIAAATSCRRSSRPPRDARSGLRPRGAGWTLSASGRRGRSHSRVRPGCARPSGAWKRSSPRRFARTVPTGYRPKAAQAQLPHAARARRGALQPA